MRMIEPEVTPSGLSLPALAGTGMRAFYAAASETPPRDAPPEWRLAAEWAVRAWEYNAGSDEPLPVGPLVRGMYHSMYPDGEPAAFDDLPQELAVALEAACRHLLGAVTCDRDDTRHMGEREAFWSEWAEARLAATEVTT
ncbi:MAG TPA: hypothetical protein VFG68_12840 [Fimbriiglobus sp.]|nr:hypothetical protein [Fimbriiglobus sp.]